MMQNKILGLLVGFTVFMVAAGPAGAMFPPGFDQASPSDNAYDAVREHNPNFREAGTFVADELVVKYKGDSQPFRVTKLPAGKSVKEAEREFELDDDVEYAEPNYIAHALMVPNDPYYPYQWHFNNAVYGGIHTESAWNASNGSGVVAAVIDTGVAYENYQPNRREKYYRAPDLAQTSFVPGYDFVNSDSHPNDDNSHGTHVTGTIAQSTNNSLGVAGVAFGASIMPVKVLGKDGSGTYADVADGIRWAADHGAKVINLSLGGPSPATYLEEALAYAYNNGVTIVAAAGNDGANVISYPAAYDQYVIAVGATRYDEALAYYSNYGSNLDLVAPGGDLNVDQNGDGYADGVLQNTFNPNTKNRSDFGYWFFQGTSMAAPHVAGVAALVLAKGNATTPDQVRAALQEKAEDLGAVGRDDTYGYGLVDAYAALQWVAGSVDNPPTVSITSPANGVTVSGLVNITANASDDNGVSRVGFYVDGVLLGFDLATPYEFAWNSTAVTDGSHTISATAVDTTSKTATHSVTVTVDNVNDLPVANAGPDKSAYVGDTVAFDGSASYDPDGSIVSHAWDFGDGATGSGVTVSHAYTTVGTYIVTLTVTDNRGATAQDTAIATVSEKPSLPTMHVGNITFSYKKYSSRCQVTAQVPILDSAHTGVAEAAVSGTWSGAYSANVSRSTNGSGTASFQTSWVKGCGTFTFTVTNATKTDWLYDSVANVETSDTIVISASKSS